MAPGDDTRAERYACDSCRSKKVACTRERSGCKRCRNTGARCTYSRSGTISRKRKWKTENRDQLHSQCQLDSGPATVGGSSSGPDSHLAADIEATRERLDRLDTPERQSFLEALSSLSETCSRKDIRPETLRLGVATGYFSRFEQHSSEWTEGTI
ncbi:hypothetical protein BJY01DRAFT_226807 [Aspergillus pseudoustus]|uniref:Zn(2)-C6 fungal-type domain-containing protein n=1 Tax=Aspergillus pseudoustus TaxID=1810923 RepID=A0ABR4ITG1_9EURO